MSTQTELEFFYKAFDIPKIETCANTIPPSRISGEMRYCDPNFCKSGNPSGFCIFKEEKYPEITDRRLLELTRICLNWEFSIQSKDIDCMKDKVMSALILHKQDRSIYNTVRKIMGVE